MVEHNNIEKLFELAEDLKNSKLEDKLLTLEELRNRGTVLTGINKIEIGGGEYPSRPDFLNIDPKAKQGICGSIFEVNGFISSDTDSDTIFMLRNPYFKGCDNPNLLMNRLLEILRVIAGNKVEGKYTQILSIGTLNNKFFNKITPDNQAIRQLEYFKFIHHVAKLPRNLRNTKSFTSNGYEINSDRLWMSFLKSIETDKKG